ncbi:MAG: hypothetical protein ISR69_13260 [Gammaproteobacteria bacterium]|nr:hypothetical protein [Gammaproteobacteria bacterium]
MKLLKQHGLLLVVGLLVLGLLSFGVYQANNQPLQTINLPIVENCQLESTACVAKLPNGGEVKFEITPKNAKPTQTLELDLQAKQVDIDSVKVKFDGKTMNMGFLEYNLKPKDSKDETAYFNGQGGLSVCIRGKMDWVVTVKIQIDNKLYNIPFSMDTYYFGG